ncbi:MAG: GGDEF domain-containing protein [Gemmatimonadetes bacterium]|nr:GGDEF domain-containing protein [Gemmatimonadota bacterium]
MRNRVGATIMATTMTEAQPDPDARRRIFLHARRLVWPEGVAVLLGLTIIRWPGLKAAAPSFLHVYPYVVLGLGLFLGWRFGRGRLLAGLVTLTLADRALAWFVASPAANAGVGAALIPLIGLLLPANLTVLGHVPEAGLAGRPARWWAGALAGQVAGVALLTALAGRALADGLALPLFPVSLERWMPLPQFSMLAFLAAAGLLGMRVLRAPDSAARGLLWATLAAFVALNAAPSSRTLYFATAGLALAVGMVEASYSLAFQDELTGLPARRAFNQALARLDGRYVVAMVDVDHFKQFNDRYGHDVGDQVLKLVARRLGEVGGGGMAFRYGGEEFAVLFPATPLEHALPYLETLRHQVEVTTFTLRGSDRPLHTPKDPRRDTRPKRRDLSVTVSIGAAAGGPAGTTPSTVAEAADRALYRAKDGGRNRVASTR